MLGSILITVYGVDNRPESIKKVYLLLLASFLLATLFYSQALVAQGVTAGTDISSKVIVNYRINGEIQTPIESSPTGNSLSGVGNGEETIFKVDRKIDLLITNNGNVEIELGDTQAKLSFVLLNTGNSTQEFALIPDSSITADNYDVSNCVTSSTTVAGEILSSGIFLSSGNVLLEPDQQVTIDVKCDVPLSNDGQPILAGQASTVSLLVVAEKNDDGSATLETSSNDSSDTVDTVFVDGAGTDDLAQDATHSSRGNYIISGSTALPVLNIDKAIIEVKDENGGNNAVSGSEVSYRIKVTTAGKGIINDVIITDVTPEDMTYQSASITLDNASLSDESDTDNGDFGVTSANTATINLGNITAGSQHEIQLTYVIN